MPAADFGDTAKIGSLVDDLLDLRPNGLSREGAGPTGTMKVPLAAGPLRLIIGMVHLQ